MNVRVGKYAITPARLLAGTAGSYGFETLRFSFDEVWRPLTKRILFAPPEGEQISLLLPPNEEITLPREVCRSAGICRFAIVGYEEEKVILTLTGELFVLDTLKDEGKDAESVTPTVAVALMERIHRLEVEQKQLWQALYTLQSAGQKEKKKPRRPPATRETEGRDSVLGKEVNEDQLRRIEDPRDMRVISKASADDHSPVDHPGSIARKNPLSGGEGGESKEPPLSAMRMP